MQPGMKYLRKSFLLSLFFVVGNTCAQSVGGITIGAVTFCTNLNSGIVSDSAYVGAILNWQSSTDGGIIWNNNSNTTDNQTYFNLNQTTCYRAIVQDGSFPPDTSTIVCITIYPESVGGTISGGGTYCDSSGAGTLTLSGSAGDILFWLSSTDSGLTWATIANTSTAENYLNLTQNTLYSAVVQSLSACPTDTSTQASFVIDPITIAGTINGTSAVCAIANSGAITLSGNNGSILGWESSINNGTNWIPITNTTATQAYLNLNQTTWYHAIVKSGSCSSDFSEPFVLNVNPVSIAGIISGGGVYCGVPATGTLTLAGFTGTIVNWLSSTDNGGSWTAIVNTSATENYTNLALTTWYKVIVQSGTCPVDTTGIEIVGVVPQTVAGTVLSSSVACSGTNIDTLFLSGNTGTITGWISSTNNGLSWNPIANTSTSQVYNGLTQTTWFAAIVQSGTCNIDTTVSAIITVAGEPAVDAGNDISIIQGQSTVLSGSGAGTPIWSPITGLSDPAVFSPTANPGSTTTYILTVTDSNSCINSDTIIITVIQGGFNGKISNLFTPNGDGINDFWYIEGIQNFPDNEVFIYNIYGKEVYTKKAYSNDWQGTYNGSELPDGTYYYVIRFDSSDKIQKGTVDILRSK